MNYTNKHIVIIGLGKSGISAGRFLTMHGAKVSVVEARPKEDMYESQLILQGVDVDYYFNTHMHDIFYHADMVVASPGVAMSHPGIIAAKEKNIPIVGDMELAVTMMDKPIIAVTGTNGKTTTTALLSHLLNSAGLSVVTGGNIGTPILDMHDHIMHAQVVLLEVSSFQLDTTPSLRPYISVLLNISPDHLDRYAGFDEYAKSKMRVLTQSRSDGFAIYNAADKMIRQLLGDIDALPSPFCGLTDILDDIGVGACIQNGNISLKINDIVEHYDIQDAHLYGSANMENMMAALLAARHMGCDSKCLQQAMLTFKGLPHRMEVILKKHGITYINDSKGTNTGATYAALEQVQGPIVLIAGGVSKGTDFSVLTDIIHKKVKHLVLMGDAASEMKSIFSKVVSVKKVSSMQKAVREAVSQSVDGDTVLLSPACASFDMFSDYADRGRSFLQSVYELCGEGTCED